MGALFFITLSNRGVHRCHQKPSYETFSKELWKYTNRICKYLINQDVRFVLHGLIKQRYTVVVHNHLTKISKELWKYGNMMGRRGKQTIFPKVFVVISVPRIFWKIGKTIFMSHFFHMEDIFENLSSVSSQPRLTTIYGKMSKNKFLIVIFTYARDY